MALLWQRAATPKQRQLQSRMSLRVRCSATVDDQRGLNVVIVGLAASGRAAAKLVSALLCGLIDLTVPAHQRVQPPLSRVSSSHYLSVQVPEDPPPLTRTGPRPRRERRRARPAARRSPARGAPPPFLRLSVGRQTDSALALTAVTVADAPRLRGPLSVHSPAAAPPAGCYAVSLSGAVRVSIEPPAGVRRPTAVLFCRAVS